VVFEADYDENYDEIELQNKLWRHHHYITEKRHQNNVIKVFPIWAPPSQNFWLRQWSWVNNLMVFKKAVLILKKWSWS